MSTTISKDEEQSPAQQTEETTKTTPIEQQQEEQQQQQQQQQQDGEVGAEGTAVNITFEISIKAAPSLLAQPDSKKFALTLQVSPTDNIQDLKQYLYESHETCYITNYHLFVDGKQLNDFAEIQDVPEIKEGSVLEMVEAAYDDRSIRHHVRRVRDLVMPSEPTTSPAVFSQITDFDLELPEEPLIETKEKPHSKENGKAEQDKAKESVSDSPIDESDIPTDSGLTLSTYYPPKQAAPVACLKSITFSGWNPPPGNRKLSGDLIYLEITTLENKTFNVTGGSKGFFVNSTTSSNFNPQPSEKPCNSHSLIGVLTLISQSFKKSFPLVLQSTFEKHPFEMFPVPFPVHPWLAPKEKHNFDLNRAEDSIFSASENASRGQWRDWNEEYQSCKELPRETIQERIIRDRAVANRTAEFVEAAIKGACAIVEKTVTPINPFDPEKAHMYIYNNIFFSYAMDGRDFFKDFGGDKAAYLSVNNDLKGIRALNRADIKGLYTLATAIVDYRGYRVVAQSIIPGILQREQTSNVVYGSIDNGKTITSDPKFHELMLEAGKSLHIKEHTVKDAQGTEVKLCTPVEAKGIVGTDNRKYILDLVRLTPRDGNFPGKQNAFVVLRPELIGAYYESLKLKEEEKEKEVKAKEAKEKGETPAAEAKETTETKEETEVPEKEVHFPPLNPNALCELTLGGTPEEILEDENSVKALSDFLLDTMIPILVEDLSWMLSLPVDGQTLTQVIHNHGVNVRYLGHIATLAEKRSNVVLKELCVREMLTRSTKHILRAVLRDTDDYCLASAVAHFLNCMFGKTQAREEGKKNNNNNKKRSAKPDGSAAFALNSSALWSQIVDDVKARFNYTLGDKDAAKSILKSIQTLRSLCQKVGIQVESKEYNLDTDTPFTSQNILNLCPVVKHTEPESLDGRGLLDVGKQFLNQGRLDIAYELLTEALAIFHQVYGPMHKDTAHCYFNLGTVLYHAKDLQQALEHQQKATVICERVLGIDHHDTAQQYATMALFSHAMGKHKLALTYMNRSLYLTRLVSGPNHPDTATIYVSIATMLQDLQQHKSALSYLMEALKSYESLIGTNHIQTASIYHAVAIAYSQLGLFKEALAYEKKNYNILHETVGDSDLRTVESNICLKQFTAKAVQMQIETKKTQRDITAQLSQVKLDKMRNTVNLHSGKGKTLTSLGTQSPGAALPPMGTRPLGEVLSYINGKSKPSFADRNKKKISPSTIGSSSIDKKKKP